MRRFVEGWLVIVALLATCVPSADRVAGASQATPLPTDPFPAPTECRVAPPLPSRLRALAALPPPPATPASGDLDFLPPAGGPVDAATLAAVTATQREAIACANGGERWRVLSLYSDGFVRRILADNAARGVSLRQLFGDLNPPRPPARANWSALTEVRDARALPDGRVGLFVTVSADAALDAFEIDFVWLVEQDGRWLIDGFEVVDLVFADDPAATPAVPPSART